LRILPDCKSKRLWHCQRILKIAAKLKAAIFIWILGATFITQAANLDTVGVTLLRTVDPSLVGSGVNVAQAEASEAADAWQVNPAAVGQPGSLFTYISDGGSSSSYPNVLGLESNHADGVGGNFYGTFAGAAPGVGHVDNYEAGHFYNSNISVGIPVSATVVNQSFTFDTNAPQITVDRAYDNYAAQNNVLFISGVGNSPDIAPAAPSTAYNGIGAGVSDGNSSIGPTADSSHRSKPDITAPGGATSFSTPYVAGAAAILRQAGLRGDGGAGTTTPSVDIRTLKALLLNGAIKPSNWTHTATAPLDTRFGAGILNVFNSYKQLAAGKFNFIEATFSGTPGGAHPPGTNPGNVASFSGWDFNTIAASLNGDKINHYYFNLPVATARTFTLTATLAWNRAFNATDAKNLNLFLYDTSNAALVASSASTVDNVEHLYVTNLAAGRYDLQVWKKGGITDLGTETYALAFESFALSLQVARAGDQVVISWPIAPTGFRLQSASNLNPPISWTDVVAASTVTNNQNRVVVDAASSVQFFRLIRP
jgi:hypothetical protein